MAAVPPKKMLETLLTAGTLSAKEREIFEGMWDAVHRYGGLSRKQTSWIEDLYYKLDKRSPAQAPVRSPKKGFVNLPGILEPKNVRSFEQFKQLCPTASPAQLKKIEQFFKSGGTVLAVRPPNGPPKDAKDVG